MTSRFAVAKQLAIDHLDDLVPELFGGGRLTHRYQNRWAVVNKWRSGADIGQMTVWRDGGRAGARAQSSSSPAGVPEIRTTTSPCSVNLTALPPRLISTSS